MLVMLVILLLGGVTFAVVGAMPPVARPAASDLTVDPSTSHMATAGSSTGPYYAIFSAPLLRLVPGGANFSFQVDGTEYNASASATCNVTGLSAGPHVISAINASASLAPPGYTYLGSASTGSVFTEPGNATIELTFADVDLSAAPISVVFNASQLPVGTPWGLRFNGTYRSSTTDQLIFSVHPGYYARTYELVVGLQGNVQYRPSYVPDYSLYPNTTTIDVIYSTYFAVGVYAGPGGSVRVAPVNLSFSWHLPNDNVAINAVGSSQYSFKSWTGTGTGSYTGESPQQNLTIGGPVNEYAQFLPRANNSGVAHFLAHGLPSGTVWTVFLGGIGYSSPGGVIVVTGLVPCTNLTAGQPGVYAATYPDIYQNLTIPGLSERFRAVAPPLLVCGNTPRLDVNYTTQYLVLDHWSGGGSVSAVVNGSAAAGGYFEPGTEVTLEASAAFGYAFSGWSGVGVGSYSGAQPQVSIPLEGSIDEVASFAAGPLLLALGYPVTFQAPAGEIVGSDWTVAVDGQWYAANGTQLTVPDVLAGNHSVAVGTIWADNGGSRSVPTVPSFPLSVAGPTLVNLSYTVSYWVSVVIDGVGTVTPGSGWSAAGVPLQLTATPGAGDVFQGWASAQAGGFTGNNSSTATITPTGPIVESAVFGPGAPAPDFWHRTSTLAAAAVGGAVVGFLVLVLIARFRQRPPVPPVPPAGAVREWSGIIRRRGAGRSSTVPPPSGRASPLAWGALTLAIVVLAGIPIAGTVVSSHGVSLTRALAPHDATGAGRLSPSVPMKSATHGLPAGGPPAPALRVSAGAANLTFIETGLPSGTAWTVSVWPFDTSEAAPSTWSANETKLSVPVATSETSVDFEVWTLPMNASTVWFGTPNVTGPIDPAPTPVVDVAFAPTLVTALTFRFHTVETGLPSNQSWHSAVLGVGYDVQTAAADWSIGGNKTFELTTPSIVLSETVEYAAPRFDVEALSVGSSWSNSSTTPLVRLANTDYWIDVNFTQEFRVHVDGDVGGVVTPPSGWYRAGQPVTITATVLAGYAFVSWSGIGLGSVNSTSTTIEVSPGSSIIELASFTQIPFLISVTESGVPIGDEYSIVLDGTIYTFNQSSVELPGLAVGDLTFAVPYSPSILTTGERYVPVNVTSTYPSAPNGTFVVTGPGSFSILFEAQYALTITTSGSGTTDPGPGSYWESSGAAVSIRGVPGAGVSFEDWRGTGAGAYSGTASGIVVVVGGPIDESAQFGPPFPPSGGLLTVTESGLPAGTPWSAAVGASGAVGATAGLILGPLPFGPTTVVVPDVAGAPGERFSAAGGEVYRFALTGNQTLAVAFAPQFLVNVTVLFGGSVADYPSWVAPNTSLSLLAQPPAPGYQFNGWGGTFTASSALITVNVTGPVQLTANFGGVAANPDTGPKDAPIAAADVGIPAVLGALVGYFWFGRRR